MYIVELGEMFFKIYFKVDVHVMTGCDIKNPRRTRFLKMG